MLPLGNRCADRPLVNHFDPEVAADDGGACHRQVTGRGQPDFGLRPGMNLRRSNDRPGLQQRLQLPGPEAPFHEFDRFRDPFVGTGQTGDDHHQPAAILRRRPGEAIAGFVGVAGLQPIRAGNLTKDRVAVRLDDRRPGPHGFAPGERGGAVKFRVQVRKIKDGTLGNDRQIARCRIFHRVRPAAGVGKIGAGQPELFGCGIHRGHILRLRPAKPFAERHTGIIAGQRHDAVQQVFHTDLLVRGQEHGRPGSRAVPFFPGLGPDGDDLVKLYLALLDQRKGQIDCHHLGHRRGRHPLPCRFGIEGLAGGQITHISEGRGGLEGRLRHDRIGQCCDCKGNETGNLAHSIQLHPEFIGQPQQSALPDSPPPGFSPALQRPLRCSHTDPTGPGTGHRGQTRRWSCRNSPDSPPATRPGPGH